MNVFFEIIIPTIIGSACAVIVYLCWDYFINRSQRKKINTLSGELHVKTKLLKNRLKDIDFSQKSLTHELLWVRKNVVDLRDSLKKQNIDLKSNEDL